MVDFPISGYMENAARTTGEMKAAFEAWLAATKQMPGGGAAGLLTVAAGVITPTKASHIIDTEGAASSDDLTNIAQTNLPDGSLLILNTAAAGRTVVLKHAAGGAGQITLQGSVDFPLTHPLSIVVLRRDGASWTEVVRNTSLAPVPAGHIWGCTLSNAVADPTNDLLIAIGEAASDAVANQRVLMATAAITKRLDATWTAGDNGGGRITSEALVDGTWHVHLFRRAGGLADVCFSQFQAPAALPDGGTYKRRIGSIIRSSGAIMAFSQKGDRFQWLSPILDVNHNNPGITAVMRTLTLPIGLRVVALMNVGFSGSTSNQLSGVYFSDPDITDEVATTTVAPLVSLGGSMSASALWGPFGQVACMTNPSAQVRTRAQATSTSITLRIATYGWLDDRGRNS